MKQILITMIVCALLTACENGEKLKQTVVTKENLVTIQKKANSGKLLSADEAQWYLLGQIQISTSRGQVIGKTVEEIIAAGKPASAPKK